MCSVCFDHYINVERIAKCWPQVRYGAASAGPGISGHRLHAVMDRILTLQANMYLDDFKEKIGNAHGEKGEFTH